LDNLTLPHPSGSLAELVEVEVEVEVEVVLQQNKI
jgi:hypothetical protein